MHSWSLILFCIVLIIEPACSHDANQAKRSAFMKTLPKPETDAKMSVAEAIAARRSIRSFADSALSDQQISNLLYATQGITDPARGYRAAPSAGATYPLETWLVTREGVFRYRPQPHALERMRSGNYLQELAKAALGQGAVSDAPAVIALTAVFERTTQRYRERGRRYVYMEAGHAAQNALLMATAIGLGGVPIGAFDNDKVGEILRAGDDEEVVYLLPIGIKERK